MFIEKRHSSSMLLVVAAQGFLSPGHALFWRPLSFPLPPLPLEVEALNYAPLNQRRSKGCGPHRAALATDGKRAKIVKKNSRENSHRKFRMCLLAIKTKQFRKPKTKGRQI